MMMHGFVHRPLAHELVQTPFFSVAWGASARGTSCQENDHPILSLFWYKIWVWMAGKLTRS